TGRWILYTSADSVFQVAAHERIVPLEELYAACEIARSMLVAPNDVARGIARMGVGKVDDLFAGRALSSVHTSDNAAGIAEIHRALDALTGGLLFANLVDFDQLW